MTTAAMSNRKKVSEIAVTSAANLMNMALEPKKIEATNSIVGPVGEDDLRCVFNQIYSARCVQSVAFHERLFNC